MLGYFDRPDADLDEDDVREHQERRIARRAMHGVVVFVEEIPLTDAGKIDKQSLPERDETAA